MKPTMKAAVLRQSGAPDVLTIENRPIPDPKVGEVLIRIKAFGLNRSEMFTRQGHSFDVSFPRILGIEAVGVVEAAPGREFTPDDVVATAMGGMGREFDGGYAEFTVIPAGQIQRLITQLPWQTLGAMPEMLQTAWGSLFTSLQLGMGQRLLIRGGTTSIGLAAAAIARSHGAHVTATTRNADRRDLLRANGAHEVIVDTGTIANEAASLGGFDRVLELIGASTLLDSLKCATRGGIVCMTGIVGNTWSLDTFNPMEAIPKAVCLTTYSGRVDDFMATPLQEFADQIAAGALRIQIGRVFQLDEIVEAHRVMEANTAGGKIVVLTS